MIISRDMFFPLWSDKNMSAAFLGKNYKAKFINGKYLITLDPAAAGGPYNMDLDYGEGINQIQDIYAGDIWLCTGQSNMEMQMERLKDDYPEEWQFSSEMDFSLIRQLKVVKEWDFSGPRDFVSGQWIKAAPDTLHEFSAAAWFFAKKMYEKEKIPIGIVNTAWGGTPIESWMSKEALSKYPKKTAVYKNLADSSIREKAAETKIKEWEDRVTNNDAGKKHGWHKLETDISKWNGITLPCDFSEAGLIDFNGIVWLAKDFEITNYKKQFAAGDEESNIFLWLGTITDADTVFINGTEIGNTGYRYPPRKYQIKEGILREGKNRIVIRVTCNNGEGGITRDKPFRLFSARSLTGLALSKQTPKGARKITQARQAPRDKRQGNKNTIGSLEFKGLWKYNIGFSVPDTRPQEYFPEREPAGPYNAMIAPILKYPLKGVIFYQGESNLHNAHDYGNLFISMIQNWRKENNNASLPFLFVQLPVFGKPSFNNEASEWAAVRESQAKALSLPFTGMVCALDIGEWNDIHPVNKKDIGCRLFLAAEKLLLDKQNTSPGPVLHSYKLQNNLLYIFFDNCGKGLIAKNNIYLSVLSEEGHIRIPAQIEGKDNILINLDNIKDLKKIFYAWADNPIDRHLSNSDDLPALPFKIDLS